jgi:7 transmembrane helices usually fused to an inactive transglutaminase
MNSSATGSRRLILEALFGIPALILLCKLPFLPTAAFFTHTFSLAGLSASMQGRLQHLMFIPLSAVVVVLFRLTLGIPVFGLFRPILLAIAFRITGLELGLMFLALVMACIVLVRPVLRVAGMHSYVREAVALGAVVIVMLITVDASAKANAHWMFAVARFPIISLCLISEHFAKALYEKGVRNAVWRGSMTVFAGVLICVLSWTPGLMHLFVRFPELLVAQIGCVVAIGRFFNLRLLDKRKPAEAPPQMFQEYASEVAE